MAVKKIFLLKNVLWIRPLVHSVPYTVEVNVDQQLFGYPHSSKYLHTGVNVCGAVQYIDTVAPELQLIECVLSHDSTIFLQKQIVETFLALPLLAK